MPALLKNKALYAVLVLALIAWKTFTHFTAEKPKDAAPSVRVSVANAIRQDVPAELSLVGTVVAHETVAVKSRLDSQIVDVLFKDGENVKEGQVLFQLDDRALVSQKKELEAELQKEKAQLINTRLQYERAQKLVKSNTVSQSQMDQARANYEAQLAQVGATQANLDSTQVQLSYAKITAPISGRAGTINVTRGNNVKANDTAALVTINQVSPIRVQFAIPQRYYDKIKAAMNAGELPVSAKRTEATDEVKGTLEYVDNAIDAGNGTFAARASFANEDEKLWPGMFVNVSLTLGINKNALTIPAVAVQGDENNHFVFIADPDGKKALRKPVKIMDISHETALIESGLDDNARVITDGLMRLTDGAAIDIVTAGDKAADKKEDSKDEKKAP